MIVEEGAVHRRATFATDVQHVQNKSRQSAARVGLRRRIFSVSVAEAPAPLWSSMSFLHSESCMAWAQLTERTLRLANDM